MKLLRGSLGVFAVIAFFCAASSAQNAFAYEHQPLVKDFEKRALEYEKMRSKIVRDLPKISDEATPEQMAAYEVTLRDAIQKQRAKARAGELFTPTMAGLIRQMVNKEFKGWVGSEIRKTVLEADTKGVPIKVNVPYPDAKELVEMSPALLLSLPQLPKPLRYRFIGRSLVVMDRDNALIIDYMKNALP